MAQVNTQPILFTASGLLSAQTGPNGIAFPVNTGNNTKRRYRIQGVKVLKVGAGGSVQIYDSASSQMNQPDLVFESDGNECPTNLGINILSGDIFVQITGGLKVWLYLDLNN